MRDAFQTVERPVTTPLGDSNSLSVALNGPVLRLGKTQLLLSNHHLFDRIRQPGQRPPLQVQAQGSHPLNSL